METRLGKEQITDILARIAQVAPNQYPTPAETVTTTACPTCGGSGWVRVAGNCVQSQNSYNARLSPCPTCKIPELQARIESSAYQVGEGGLYQEMNFDNFVTSRPGYTQAQIGSLQRALSVCQRYAADPRGWLILAGRYGCGKTHLAASISNATRLPRVFMTMPDLLDQLRDGFGDSSFDFQDRFDNVREIPLLVLDDFGSEATTGWASEKIFQLVNARYVRQLPTVFTTNADPNQLDGRVMSRMFDQRLSVRIKIDAPDYRREK